MLNHNKTGKYVDSYFAATGLWDQEHAPTFQAAIRKTKRLGTKRMTRHATLKMIQRRARGAEILTPICCHRSRATGFTDYLKNGGTLHKAQQMAAHESPKSTNLYDRTQVAVTLDRVERNAI